MAGLQHLWENGQCLLMSGIAFADGRVTRIKLDAGQDSSRGRGVLHREGPVSHQALDVRDQVGTTYYTELCEATDPTRDMHVVAGGAGMGEDGFVALLKASEKKLQWLAFFDFSNPFESVQIGKAALTCKNNLGEIWSFPLDCPENVQIISK